MNLHSLTRLSRLAYVILFVASASAISWGEKPAGGTGNAITDFRGELVGSQRGVLIVKREDGVEVRVTPPDEAPSFRFIAKALPAYLSRGQLVRFSGNFNRGGQAQGPIEKVILFKPLDRRAKLNSWQKQLFVPGIYPDTKHNKENIPSVAKVQIVGAAMGIDSTGVMMVQAGKQTLRVPLAPNVVFEICVNDLSMAQAGDKVNVGGFYQPPDDTVVKAGHVTITTDRVYGEEQESPKKSRRSRSKKKSKKDKDAAGSSTKKK